MTDNHPHPTLDCDDALEIASASFDGEASSEEIDRLATHLVACAGCRTAIEALESQDAWLREMGRRTDETSGAPEAVVPISRGRKSATGRWIAPRRSRWLPAALAAAAVLAFLVARPVDDPESIGPTVTEVEDLADHDEGGITAPLAGSGETTESLAVELNQRSARAETLLAQKPRSNPFRDRRSINPFRDSASDRDPGPSLRPFAGPHPFRAPGRSTEGRPNRSRQRL